MVALLLVLLQAAPGLSLSGYVRAAGSGTPIVGAEVDARRSGDAPGAVVQRWSDSTGRYTLRDLPPGTYHVQVREIGYAPREFDVFLAGPSGMELDVDLAAQVVRLPPTRIFANAALTLNADEARDSLAELDVGSVVVRGDALHDNPLLAQTDALSALSVNPGVGMRPETPTSLHVWGASASENSIRIDGVPVIDPYHAGGILTALDPDIVSSVILHAGAPSAELGDATGSIIDIATGAGSAERVTMQGALWPGVVRQAVSGPFSDGKGMFLLSGQKSVHQSLSDPTDRTGGGVTFGDLFAKGTHAFGPGTLEAFAFYDGNDLAFDARAERDRAPESTPGDGAPGIPVRNALRWSTTTDAMRWRSSGAATSWDVRAWYTRFDASFDWAGTTHLASALGDAGVIAQSAWRWGSTHLTAGIDADRLDVNYRVSDIGPPSSPRADSAAPSGAPLELAGSPTLVAAFTEARWRMGAQWSAAVGLRDQLARGGWRSPEPRLSIRFTPVERVSLAVGYARLHQYMQSLRNEESLFDAVAGITLPVVAGSASATVGSVVPTAHSDQVEATLGARLPGRVTLHASAFARRAGGLTMVAPISMAPFATSAFAVGTERASGFTIALVRNGARITGDIGYARTFASAQSGGDRYTPSFAAGQALSIGVGVHAWSATTVRLALSANDGLPTSIIDGHIEWQPYSASAGEGDLAGSPQRLVGTLDGARLPPYARVDVSIRHQWLLPFFGRAARVTTTAAITNLLDRVNTLGLASDPGDGAIRAFLLPQRSAILGVAWSY